VLVEVVTVDAVVVVEAPVLRTAVSTVVEVVTVAAVVVTDVPVN
jgi:hypothetical protein